MISPPKTKPFIHNGWIDLRLSDGKVWRGDAIEMLRQLGDESIDLCIFDPAYESLEKHRATGTTTRLSHSKSSSNDWFKTFPNSRYHELFIELFRVMKKGTFVFMFCDEETRDVVLTGTKPQEDFRYDWPTPPVSAAGFKYWKAVIWDKMTRGMGYHFPAQHEYILMLEKVIRKGKHRRLNINGTGDVMPIKRLKGKEFYPTEKPRQLYEVLIQEGSDEGDMVLDMFAGSGVCGEVCRDHNRRFLLGDINVQEILKRLR